MHLSLLLIDTAFRELRPSEKLPMRVKQGATTWLRLVCVFIGGRRRPSDDTRTWRNLISRQMRMINMKPDSSKITIDNNRNKIRSFLSEVIFAPRANMVKWATLTNQTPNLKIGYPGQHLASLITGMRGTATGARGEDIVDGTEVKSCSRVDQVDKCLACGNHVMRCQNTCPSCGSPKIQRNNDSKWLIAIRKSDELEMYLNRIPRMLFIISDYPNFDTGDFSSIRFTSYEIWNQSPRAINFRVLLEEYYHKIFLAHISKNPEKTPAPKNFWPYSQQFYLCNPIKTFEYIVYEANSTHPDIDIRHYVEPDADRGPLPSVDMPIKLLNKKEYGILRRKGIDVDNLEYIDEGMRAMLSLRGTSKAKPQKSVYKRH